MSILRTRLKYSSHFLNERKKYIKNNQPRFEDYKKAVSLFVSNPAHSSLNLEKLQNAKGIYTIRLNKGDRIFFVWKKESIALFIDIGKHDKYRRH